MFLYETNEDILCSLLSLTLFYNKPKIYFKNININD